MPAARFALLRLCLITLIRDCVLRPALVRSGGRGCGDPHTSAAMPVRCFCDAFVELPVALMDDTCASTSAFMDKQLHWQRCVMGGSTGSHYKWADLAKAVHSVGRGMCTGGIVSSDVVTKE